MSRVDFYAIEQAIAAQIAADVGVQAYAPMIVVEDAVMMEEGARVGIYLGERDVPPDLQSISAGTRTRYHLAVSVWSFAYGYTITDAMVLRDNLLSAVEIALMKDGTFGRGDINTSWIKGGKFDSARDEKGFNVGAETKLIVDVTAIDT